MRNNKQDRIQERMKEINGFDYEIQNDAGVFLDMRSDEHRELNVEEFLRAISVIGLDENFNRIVSFKTDTVFDVTSRRGRIIQEIVGRHLYAPRDLSELDFMKDGAKYIAWVHNQLIDAFDEGLKPELPPLYIRVLSHIAYTQSRYHENPFSKRLVEDQFENGQWFRAADFDATDAEMQDAIRKLQQDGLITGVNDAKTSLRITLDTRPTPMGAALVGVVDVLVNA